MLSPVVNPATGLYTITLTCFTLYCTRRVNVLSTLQIIELISNTVYVCSVYFVLYMYVHVCSHGIAAQHRTLVVLLI